jgi:hypothetical protein
MTPLTVVGICSYHPAVHRWFATLREHFDGPCLLYLTNPTPDLSEQLAERYQATVIPTQVPPDFWKPKPVGTLCEQWRYLHNACVARAGEGHTLRTDVWDVVFQDDPRRYIDPASPKIIASWEGPRIADQPTNRVWIRRWSALFDDAAVVNGGMICGPRRALAVLAALVSRAALRTRVDQSELELIAAAFPDSFEHRPLFLECLYQAFDQRGVVDGGRICDRQTRQPWCVVHANGAWRQTLFEELFPLARYTPQQS